MAGPPGPYMSAYGTNGSCAVVGDKVAVHVPGKAIEEHEPPALKYPWRNAPEYFIHCLESGEPIEGCCSAEVSYDAQMILEAGLRSADTGRHNRAAPLTVRDGWADGKIAGLGLETGTVFLVPHRQPPGSGVLPAVGRCPFPVGRTGCSRARCCWGWTQPRSSSAA